MNQNLLHQSSASVGCTNISSSNNKSVHDSSNSCGSCVNSDVTENNYSLVSNNADGLDRGVNNTTSTTEQYNLQETKYIGGEIKVGNNLRAVNSCSLNQTCLCNINNRNQYSSIGNIVNNLSYSNSSDNATGRVGGDSNFMNYSNKRCISSTNLLQRISSKSKFLKKIGRNSPILNGRKFSLNSKLLNRSSSKINNSSKCVHQQQQQQQQSQNSPQNDNSNSNSNSSSKYNTIQSNTASSCNKKQSTNVVQNLNTPLVYGSLCCNTETRPRVNSDTRSLNKRSFKKNSGNNNGGGGAVSNSNCSLSQITNSDTGEINSNKTTQFCEVGRHTCQLNNRNIEFSRQLSAPIENNNSSNNFINNLYFLNNSNYLSQTNSLNRSKKQRSFKLNGR